MLNAPPEVVLAILRSAQTAEPDPRLGEVLEAFRRHWLAIAQRRYPGLRDEAEDAVQTALLKLVSSEKLATLRDAARLEPWARSVFVHTVLDVARDGRRHQRGRAYLGQPDDDPEHALRDQLPAPGPSPEDTIVHRQRLEIVAQTTARLEVARLKFVEDLSEKEIAERQQLSRDGVAGQLKRIRKTLRKALGEDG